MTNKEVMYKEFAEHFSEENTKLKAEIEKLKQNIIDSTNETYTMQKLDHELLTKEIEQLQSINAKLCEEIAELKGEQMKLNTDDTFEEQYINSMHRESDCMINCEKCARLFYIDKKIGLSRLGNNIPLLCSRCRKEKL